jgi:hypothetical protein
MDRARFTARAPRGRVEPAARIRAGVEGGRSRERSVAVGAHPGTGQRACDRAEFRALREDWDNLEFQIIPEFRSEGSGMVRRITRAISPKMFHVKHFGGYCEAYDPGWSADDLVQ